jgi:hypothetical protein
VEWTNFKPILSPSLLLCGNATVKAILSSPNLHDNLHQPLSKEAYEEFCDLSIYLQFIEISEDKDKWSYI